jgi:hypothetical protein
MSALVSLCRRDDSHWYVTADGQYLVGFSGPAAHELAARQRTELAELLNVDQRDSSENDAQAELFQADRPDLHVRRKELAMITTIAGLLVVAMSAQTLLVSPPQATTRLSPPLAKPITVLGCLQSDQRVFSLTADTSAMPTGTSATRSSPTGAPAPPARMIIYTLTPALDVNLKTHMGQIVEITAIEAPSETSVTTTESSRGMTQAKTTTITEERSDATMQATAPAEIVTRALNVTAVKTVAAACRPPK